MRKFKKKIIEGIKQFIESTHTDEELERLVQKPHRPEQGDFTFACFKLAKEWYFDSAQELAKDIKDKVEWDRSITPEVQGGHLNFHIDIDDIIGDVLSEVLEEGEDYGKNEQGRGKTVVFDYSSPNIGKPLHVGHIRSTILGDSIIKILKFNGYHTWGINYMGDVGLHVGKIITAFNEWGDKEKLEANPEEEILRLYIDFCKKESEDASYTERAKQVVELLENGDKDTQVTHTFIQTKSLIAFDRVYKLLDLKFDEIVGQSAFSDKGKAVVQEALDKGVAYKAEDGGIFAKLRHHGLPDKVLLRSDGTAIYSTQDLGTAKYRKEMFDFHKSLYVVACEQELYFKQLFKILEDLGHEWAKDCMHINFGMIHMDEGKMSTREGKIIYLEEVLNKAVDKAREIIDEKNPDLEDKEEVARIVGVGAIKYMILNVDYIKSIEFSWDRALDLTGNSAAYIQYTHARASSIIRKSGKEDFSFDPADFATDCEKNLVKKIGDFPFVAEKAANAYKPHLITNYAYELSSLFNQFYNKENVLKDKDKQDSRLNLVKAYTITVKNAMGLLGIDVPEKM